MRKIKFRAWDKYQKVMLSWEDLLSIRYNTMWYKDNRGEDYINCLFTDDVLELMQFTGLYDKNHTEIYVGDILNLHSTIKGYDLFEVIWDDKRYGVGIKYYCDSMNHRSKEYEYSIKDFFSGCSISGEVDYEIVGNIYKNK